jgi:hypothetical protein|tara:strand:+ start:2305 stop:2760 length:456 start_codon:yes stop_codon:yes gene_type:complete
MKFSKSRQVGYKGRKNIPVDENATDSEAPVQAALDKYVELKGFESFRVPDSFWTWVHNPKSKVPLHIKKIISGFLKGWADRTVFLPLGDKYVLGCCVEAKSKTGKFSSKKQENMAKALNYQIPRSPEKVIEIINEFEKFHNKLEKILENGE